MINLAPTTYENLGLSAIKLVEKTIELANFVILIGKVAFCTDSVYTTGRAVINFYCSPNPIAKVFFGASSVFGVIGITS